MDNLQADIASWTAPAMTARSAARSVSREQLVYRLEAMVEQGGYAACLKALTDYVGATHYMLAHYDLSKENNLDLVVASDWPFDLVRRLSSLMIGLYSRTTELEKCLAVLQPSFLMLPDDMSLPAGISRDYCAITFNVGTTRLSLMLLFPENVILSQERLRDVGLLAAYFASTAGVVSTKTDREFDLTEREFECLFWISEGKTSDEIAVILGISRNTINNYITSVMRKTATKTRSEAIAYAVRNNLV
ncbi:transcriptional regulator VisN [Pararhizobium sp.]|uniref:transcriptional regulator VisN n=1 Tax=Pararhizobium sp. TaxID=1977563 RepID=UPI00271CCAE8|nr:helix-turn-helix domain-containing protein [Pararhizobium sp.]MDO9416078.1 helix-turn-helix domain-containing protein [Pararhizobium sp.]